MQPATMLPKLKDVVTQTISFYEGDGINSVEVYAPEVIVTTDSANHDHSSSKVKIKNVVDYTWEPKFYSGQLLAVHMSGKYLAYYIKAPNAVNPGTWVGMVRVIYNDELGRRALIKGMKGEVQDLAFAHIQNQAILACIDEQGNFLVNEIEVTDSGLRCTLLADVRDDTGAGGGGGQRVVWCPYIPDEDDDSPDDDVARLLLTTHGNVARMWNMRTVAGSAATGAEYVLSARALLAAGGVLSANEHAAPIVDAAFSPDGSALATAAADGYVMFFQVYMQGESSPRCLHKWQPHGGQPLSCLFFLDNHKNYNTDVQFWKFAVTGADNNSCIKIWSCKSWNCLQTFTFPASPAPALSMKAAVDASAQYLVVAGGNARALYVLHIARGGEAAAAATAIAEFLLPFPALGFSVLDAEEQPTNGSSPNDDPFLRNGATSDSGSPAEYDREEESGGGRRVGLRLYIVQPKGLKEGRLVFSHPPPPAGRRASESGSEGSSASALNSSILQQQSQQLKNLLMRSQTQPGSLVVPRPESPPAPLNLMTPDAFSSPGKREEEDPPLSATPDAGPKPRAPAGTCIEEIAIKLTSGGSSPSREVQQIMAHGDADDGFYKESSDESELRAPPAADAFPPAPPPALDVSLPTETSWPQISVPQVSPPAALPEKPHSLSNSLSASCAELPREREERGLSAADRARLEALELKLDKLTELVRAQSREVRAPRALLDEALHAHAQRTTQAIDAALTAGWDRIAALGEAASARAASAAGVGAARALEPLAAALQHELAAKLSATDRLLKDNIEKLVSNKTVMDRLSGAAARAVAEQVRDSFRGALLESVLPCMEKAHAQIFHQVNLAFQAGTKEFAANTEAAARAAAERGGAAATASLRAALERHASLLAAATPPHQPTPQLLAATVREVLEKEMGWWREQARSVVAVQMSRAHSPATPSAQDRQMQLAQIQSLMKAGDVNGAFQQALSASDLALVVCTCRAADPAHVFGPPCKLKQHVLLSLVQQLAADLATDTGLKHRYLEEAVMNLDTSSPVTREHLPGVVRELQKQLMAFLSAHPEHALARHFRMLLMATDSLVKTV